MHRSSNADLSNCLAAIVALPVLGWIAYEAFPLSMIALGSGLVAGAIYISHPIGRDAGWVDLLRTRIVIEFGRMALWFAVATAIVCAVQVVVNLFRSRVSPEALLGAQAFVYKLASQLEQALSFQTTALIFGSSLFLAAVVRGPFPFHLAGKARRIGSSLFMLFGSLSLFTFASTQYAEGQVRAAIVRDLHQLAALRRSEGALRWIAAEAQRERQHPETVSSWNDMFREEFEPCLAGTSAASPGDCEWDFGRIIHNMLDQRPSDGVASRSELPWLSDFAPYIDEVKATDEASAPVHWDYPPPLVVKPRLTRLEELHALEQAVRARKNEVSPAVAELKGLAVQGFAELLGPDLKGVAEAFVGQLKEVVLQILVDRVVADFRRVTDQVRLPRLLQPAAAMRAAETAMSDPVAAPDDSMGQVAEAGLAAPDNASLSAPAGLRPPGLVVHPQAVMLPPYRPPYRPPVVRVR